MVWQEVVAFLHLLSLECSTPCGISGLAGFPNQGERILSIVLNALRHQWFGRDGPTFQGALGNLVLNALRHQWFGRGCDAGHGTRTRCVLNALRHQWFGSVGLVENARPPASAQRLAASVVWQGISNVLLTDGTEGAQRLAASVVWQMRPSLNSLTHVPVLNALRHQWFGSVSCLGAWCQGMLCSTPCGISGLAVPHSNPLPLQTWVLNALRHQWFGSPVTFTVQPLDRSGAQRLAASVGLAGNRRNKTKTMGLCSTPCGISGLAGCEGSQPFFF